jgi:thiol-disulfide isomerase/thioredoxin
MDSEKDKVKNLKKAVADGKHVFLLIYMNGCGPCNETKPKWYEFEKKHEDDDNVSIIDIEQGSIGDVGSLIGKSPSGFPCMRYIKDGEVEDYEDCENIDKTKLRTLDSFEEWLQEKMGKEKKQDGGSRRRRATKKRRGRKKKGGKWSMKYKKSINCKRPKGFSQRQHCKYGRKK